MEGSSASLQTYGGFYYLDFQGISVGEKKLQIDPLLFKRGLMGQVGVVIDSGTTFTFLKEEEGRGRLLYSSGSPSVRQQPPPFAGHSPFPEPLWKPPLFSALSSGQFAPSAPNLFLSHSPAQFLGVFVLDLSAIMTESHDRCS
ncbi:hypothetical protein NL676_029328 [Syzygium grande]|nr:hypothetical protein NL676_029328 [Syzygium grande]